MVSLKSFIKNENPIGEYKLGHINVFVRQQLQVNINNIIQILKKLPLGILNTVKSIEIGDFDSLNNRQVQALYDNKTIYISSKLESEKEYLDNIIHEFAHACEQIYYNDLYADGHIELEFQYKRQKMQQILDSYGICDIPEEKFKNVEYDHEFDTFLYKDIGYSKLDYMLRGIFLSPYAATSLREYFANGFEKYFLENSQRVREISPVLYDKISLFQDS